jgi:hypothetical protein
MKKGANNKRGGRGYLNANERKRSKAIKYDKKDSQDRELTSHRLGLNRQAGVYGEDSMTLDWEEFDNIPDIGDIEK